MSDWKVCKRDGQWMTYQREQAVDRFPTLQAAFYWALRCAYADELYAPDGITRLRKLIDDADWWHAYEAACDRYLENKSIRSHVVSIDTTGPMKAS